MKKFILSLLLCLVLPINVTHGTEYRGSFTDILTAPRSDLYSHAAVTGACTIIGGYGLEVMVVSYNDEIAAVTCLIVVSSKEWLKDTKVD